MRKELSFIGLAMVLVTTSGIAQTNTFPSSGNVGIGTTEPNGILDIERANDSGVILQLGTNETAWFDFSRSATTGALSIQGSQTGYDNIVLAPSGGNVGIGTASPGAGVSMSGGLTINGTATVLTVQNNGTNSLALNPGSPGKAWTLFDYASGSWAAGISQMNGAVGIGTTNPGAVLEVNGNIKMTYNPSNPTSLTFADGTTQTTAYTGTVCGGDYAESVDVTGDRTRYEPGDVLVIDPDVSGKFLKSAEPYSTAVTGIYSTKPGTIGRRQTGPKSPGEVPMAMIGIVPTRVSAENGPIRRGDLLVTSSIIGYAMKGTDRSRLTGAVIGKALGNLDSGTGVIEVVVTLQ